MITAFIVIFSLVLALAFTIGWLAMPGLRKRIERPKHLFAEQVRQYDQQCHESAAKFGARSDDPE